MKYDKTHGMKIEKCENLIDNTDSMEDPDPVKGYVTV